jgi:membrane-bound lytic murein transglycosylase F
MARFACALLMVAVSLPASRAAAAPLTPVTGVLRVLVSTDEQPEFFSFSAGGPPGLEREMVETFARARALRVRVVPVANFDQMIPSLLRGEGDLIVGIVNTEARRQQIAFTHETYPIRHLAVTHRPQPTVDSLAVLRPLRVGVIPGTTWADAAAEAGVPAANRVPCTDSSDLVAALRTGRIEAGVMTVFDFSMARRRDDGLEAGIFLGAPGEAAWGIRKDDVALAQALNQYLDDLRTSPARSALLTKYFDDQALRLVRRARAAE